MDKSFYSTIVYLKNITNNYIIILSLGDFYYFVNIFKKKLEKNKLIKLFYITIK